MKQAVKHICSICNQELTKDLDGVYYCEPCGEVKGKLKDWVVEI